MTALSDHIDRLAHSTRSIKSVAESCGSTGTGPFTRAILTTELGDLIRDVDSSEFGLFFIKTPSTAVAHDKETRNQSGVEITRAEFHGATPLRKPIGRRDDVKPNEPSPEVYAKAALKYMNRYQHLRPMPKAHKQVNAILDQLTVSNERIRSISEQLQQIQTTESPSLKSATDEEQQRIDKLQSRIMALRQHKESLLKKKPQVKPHSEDPTSLIGPTKPAPKPADPLEEQFWGSPGGASAKPLRFTDNMLLDEEAEFSDMHNMSFSSPTHHSPSAKPHPVPVSPEPSVQDSPQSPVESEAESSFNLAPSKESVTELEPFPTIDTPRKENLPSANMDVERAVVRIWSTAGDLIMPGHSFNTTNNLPPIATATISHLESISSLTPTTASSTHSVPPASKGTTPPTAQQILTAHLLLALLTSETLSLPLNKVKELLATKASTSGSAAMVSGHPKALYGCVAKRLLKIERGRGGQVVKFDI